MQFKLQTRSRKFLFLPRWISTRVQVLIAEGKGAYQRQVVRTRFGRTVEKGNETEDGDVTERKRGERLAMMKAGEKEGELPEKNA